MSMPFLWVALGGLGLFILGMKLLSEGLQKSAGERFRHTVERLTGNRLMAAFMGSGLSSLLQSDCATTILIVGFLNSGLLSLYQALGVFLGTGIGITLTIQFIAFKVSFISYPAICVGVACKLFSRRRRLVYVGDLLLGIGLVFLGLQTMEAGFLPLGQSAFINGINQHFLSWRVWPVAVGAFLTFIIQSSSAATGVIIALAGSGLIGLETGSFMVIGEALGATAIASVAAINGTPTSRKAVTAFFMICLSMTLLVVIFFNPFSSLVEFVTPSDTPTSEGALLAQPSIARYLANTHTIFSVLTLLIFLPLVGFIARLMGRLFPSGDNISDLEPRSRFLDVRVVNTPSIALLQAKNEIRRMATICEVTYDELSRQLHRFDARRAVRIRQREEALDILQRDISAFLVLLAKQPIMPEHALQVPALLHMTSHLEQIGDQSKAVLEYLLKKKEHRIVFSTAAMAELKELAIQVGELVQAGSARLAGDAWRTDPRISTLGKDLDELHALMVSSHVERLTTGKCKVAAGIIYNDMVNSFIKIAEHVAAINDALGELP